MDSDTKEWLREQARDDCIKYGAPNLGIDHSNHYKPVPYQPSPIQDSKQEIER